MKTALQPNIPLPEVDCCNWEEVFTEAKQQAVSLLFYDTVAPLLPQIDHDLRSKIESNGMRVVMSNLNVGNAQARLTKQLSELEIPHLILKGESSAFYYPKPQMRTLGDVDFIVSPEAFQPLHHRFAQLGYRYHEEQIDHHITYQSPGATLEMHRQLPGLPQGKAGEILQEYLQDMLGCRQKCNIGSGDFSAPAPALHGLILLLHSQHHLLNEGLGLRHLMDWCCYVNRTWKDAFWQEDLLPLLKRIGLFRFASILTGTCAAAFGTDCPPWVTTEAYLCQELLEDILSGGNFGRKDTTRQASGLMISKEGKKRSKFSQLWATFHHSVREHYPICKKCGVFYLVFYPLRGTRYLFRMLTGKRESLISAIPQANQRRNLYGQLQIFEVEENG